MWDFVVQAVGVTGLTARRGLSFAYAERIGVRSVHHVELIPSTPHSCHTFRVCTPSLKFSPGRGGLQTHQYYKILKIWDSGARLKVGWLPFLLTSKFAGTKLIYL